MSSARSSVIESILRNVHFTGYPTKLIALPDLRFACTRIPQNLAPPEGQDCPAAFNGEMSRHSVPAVCAKGLDDDVCVHQHHLSALHGNRLTGQTARVIDSRGTVAPVPRSSFPEVTRQGARTPGLSRAPCACVARIPRRTAAASAALSQ